MPDISKIDWKGYSWNKSISFDMVPQPDGKPPLTSKKFTIMRAIIDDFKVELIESTDNYTDEREYILKVAGEVIEGDHESLYLELRGSEIPEIPVVKPIPTEEEKDEIVDKLTKK